MLKHINRPEMSCKYCNSENSLTVTDYSSLICLECGIEKPYSIDIKMHQNFADNPALAYSQLYFTYSRKHRFKNYLEQVCGISSGCHANAKIWSLLETFAPFETIEKLLQCMQRIKCKHKHYECIHAFTKTFVSSYKRPKPLSLQQIKLLRKRFDDILMQWKKCFFGTNELFFSYPWLILKVLHELKITRFDHFIKKLRCRKRVQKYETMLKRVYGKPILNETLSLQNVYSTSVPHSQKNEEHLEFSGSHESNVRNLLKTLTTSVV